MSEIYEPTTDTDRVLDLIQEEGQFDEAGGTLGQADFEDALIQ